jgi:nicotinate dehydrogenase subunit A
MADQEGRGEAISCCVNDHDVILEIDHTTPLLYVLRNDLGLKGTRFGCGAGDCGACMVLLDGRPVNACDIAVSGVDGKSVTTVEALAETTEGRALIEAFTKHQAAQCGYCASGILMSAVALLRRSVVLGELDVRVALDRHLCRCGSHGRIINSVLSAAWELQHG